MDVCLEGVRKRHNKKYRDIKSLLDLDVNEVL